MAKNKTLSAFRPKLVSLAVASCFAASSALANPTNPTVVHGAANFANPAANVLNVTTATSKTIINWGSFSINANELTKFLQPSAASAVLNRVAAGNPSQILGALQSNGRVFIVNPSGIMFGAGSQVDVAGLIATSLNLSNADFLADRLKFTDGASAGSVINMGNITTGSGGEVYLVGNAVTNNGIITSPNGTVVLAAGNSVELVNPGTPNLRVEIVAPDNEARNLGQIVVDSGRAGIYAGLINNSGTVRADSVVSEGGRILLKATKSVTLEDSSVLSAQGKGGGKIEVLATDSVRVAGKLDASAPLSGDGGFIETSAHQVKIADGAQIGAAATSGKKGVWLIDPVDFIIGGGTPDITGAALATQLDTGGLDVFITTGGVGGDIFVYDGVSWNSANGLTLTAHRNVNVNASIINSGSGGINLNAGWDGSNPTSTTPPVPNAGDIVINFSSVDTGGNVSFRAGQDIQMNAGRVWAGFGSSAGNRSLTFDAGRNIALTDPDGGANVEATALSGFNATVTFNAADSILVQGSKVYAKGGDAASGGFGLVQFMAGSGGISIQDSASPNGVFAYGGYASGGSTGGDGNITLSTSGSISVGNSHVRAYGGDSGLSPTGIGGNSVVSFGASTIEVANGSLVKAKGGSAANVGGNGTVEFVTSSGDITVNGSELRAGAGTGTNIQPGMSSVSLNSAGGILLTNLAKINACVHDGTNCDSMANQAAVHLLSAAGDITVSGSSIRAYGRQDTEGTPASAISLTAGGTGASVNISTGTLEAKVVGGGEAQVHLSALGTGAINVTGSSNISATDDSNTPAAQLNLLAGSGGITVTESTLTSNNTGFAGLGGRTILSSAGDVTLSDSNVSSNAGTSNSAVTGIDAAGNISATNTAISASSNSGSTAIVGLRAGGNIILSGGQVYASAPVSSLVGMHAGGNIQLGGSIQSYSNSAGGAGWFVGNIPTEVAGLIPATFSGVALNAGNQIVGGSTGSLYSGTGDYALQAVNGIGTPLAPVRFAVPEFDGIVAKNTGSSGDIAFNFVSGCCVFISSGANLLNSNPTGIYYVQAHADGGEGRFITLTGAFKPGGFDPLPGQTVHFKVTTGLLGNSGIGISGGSISGAGQVILEATSLTTGNSGIEMESGSFINSAGSALLKADHIEIQTSAAVTAGAGDVLLKANIMDIQGSVTATNNIFVTPLTPRTIELGALIDDTLALSATELSNLYALGLGIGSDGVNTNSGTIIFTLPVGPFNAFPNLFGTNITQNSGATINSPAGLNAFSSGGIVLAELGNNIGSFGGTAGTSINIVTTGNLALGAVTAGSSASFTSSGGAILNTSGLANITSPNVSLTAATGIGSGIPIMLTNASPTGVTAINTTSGGIGLLQTNGTFTVGAGGWNVQNAPGGEIIIEGMNVTLAAGAPNSGPLEIFASNEAIVGPTGYASTNSVVLVGGNKVNVNGNLSAGDLILLGLNEVNINGAIAQGNTVSVISGKLNVKGTTTPGALLATTDLGVLAGEINVTGGTGPGAFAEIKAGPGSFYMETFAGTGTTGLLLSGNINLKGGSGSGAYARIFGDPDVGTLLLPVSVGGVINMDAGIGTGAYARIESASVNSINVNFTNLSSGGFFVNGVENTVSAGESGFFAGGLPAVPGQNFLVTYGGTPLVISAFEELPPVVQGGIQQAINQVVAATNDQTTLTQENAISGDSESTTTGGTTEEKQKKALPICGK